MTGAVDVQTAIYKRLTAENSLTLNFAANTFDDLTGVGAGLDTLRDTLQGVYDWVPQDQITGDADFPYVVIGEDTAAPWDTDTKTGAEWTVTVHSWSRYAGQKEIKQIQDACYDVLHRASLAVSNFDTITVEWEFGETLLDPDGLTHHGVQRYRLLLQQSP